MRLVRDVLKYLSGFVVVAGLSGLVAHAQTVVLNSALAGTNEVANGDPDGTGRGTVTIDTSTGAYSWSISAFNILTPSAAHIHRGAAGVNGPVVADFSAALSGTGTMTTALAVEIAGNPAGFYFNVHTSAHPGGAIRGQLTAAALPSASTFISALSGANEVANGDPDGTGTASIRIDPVTGAAIWIISTSNVDTPTAAHIHRAAAGSNGPVVFDFGGQLNSSGVMPLALAAEILGNPTGFYFNVHTAAHPGGAVRGQLVFQPQPNALANVPTLHAWALILLAGMLAGFAFFTQNRQVQKS